LGQAEALLGDADVAFGQPDADQCAALGRLRWVHLSSAGYTAFDRPAIREALVTRGAYLSTSSSVYSEPCAQHVLALMLAEVRQIPRSLRHQLTDRAWQTSRTRAEANLLHKQTVAMVGFGAIGRRLVELLAPFGLTVFGVRRRPDGREPVPMVPLADVDGLLARADHVVNILPASAETARFFDRTRFAGFRPGGVFYNIGRGTTVDQEALIESLASGRLRAAYLDVTDPEPLPPEHPLWSAPNCVITPHSAGGHADEQERLVHHFLKNLRRFETNESLADRIL
jgi:phosphoglycerate dehydrogenase-like enzyme